MKQINRSEWSALILVLSIILGAFMRFNPTLLAGFPINDGGMFAVMLDELKDNHYLLPAFTAYNYLDIPFVYPPLGFYVGNLASELFGWSTIETLRWMPAFFSSLSIPAFYLLASRLLKGKYQASIATFFFALMPRAYFWFIMGGGLTRALGQLFMLLALSSLVRLYKENRRVDVLWAGLFCGFTVLSHPEAAIYTVVSGLLFWIILSRNRAGLVNSLLVAFITLVISAPWWLAIVNTHGIGPLLSGAATGQRTLAAFHLLFLTFAEEPYVTLITVLGLIGVASCLIRREYLLPLWMAVPFVVAGRSAVNAAAIPLAMLASIGLLDVIFEGLNSAHQEPDHVAQEESTPLPARERNIFLYVMLYLLFSAYQFGMSLSTATLYPADREAMSWVRKNTPADSRFLLLTGSSSVACDAVLEWFPTLASRHSISTIQGTEWTQGPNFTEYVKSTFAVQKCLSSSDRSCLDDMVDPSKYDYIYLSKNLRSNNCVPTGTQEDYSYFVEHLREIPGLVNLYETKDVLILSRSGRRQVGGYSNSHDGF